MARKGSIISCALNGSVMTFNVEGAGSLDLDLSAVSEDLRNLAMAHGFRQKISDAAAMPKGDPNNTPEGKLAAMTAVRDNLLAGTWAARSSDGSGPVSGIIYRAFERWVVEMATAKKAKAPDAKKIRAVYDAKERKEQLALRNIPRIAEIIEELKAERGPTTSVDTDELLGALGI